MYSGRARTRVVHLKVQGAFDKPWPDIFFITPVRVVSPKQTWLVSGTTESNNTRKTTSENNKEPRPVFHTVSLRQFHRATPYVFDDRLPRCNGSTVVGLSTIHYQRTQIEYKITTKGKNTKSEIKNPTALKTESLWFYGIVLEFTWLTRFWTDKENN